MHTERTSLPVKLARHEGEITLTFPVPEAADVKLADKNDRKGEPKLYVSLRFENAVTFAIGGKSYAIPAGRSIGFVPVVEVTPGTTTPKAEPVRRRTLAD